MSQSLANNYLHITFGTKNRQPMIFPPYEEELHTYIGGICKELDSPVLAVGGYNDHIHILCMLSKKIALMNFIEKIKSNSSKWMKTRDISLQHFYWQDGYGAFSVTPTSINAIIAYIKNQHKHHAAQTFQDEYRGLLKKYEVKYDEKYLWN